MNEQFEELWHFCATRRAKPMVQVKEELEQIFGLISDEKCRSYLEIGTAEGDSLYILSHALEGNMPSLTYVDFGEAHTTPYRDEVLGILRQNGMKIKAMHGNSHDHNLISEAALFKPYDVVYIDAGHELRDVIADAIAYGGMARKFIIFHDILLNDVGNAFNWYVESQGFKDVRRIYAKGSEYGFGVIKL